MAAKKKTSKQAGKTATSASKKLPKKAHTARRAESSQVVKKAKTASKKSTAAKNSASAKSPSTASKGTAKSSPVPKAIAKKASTAKKSAAKKSTAKKLAATPPKAASPRLADNARKVREREEREKAKKLAQATQAKQAALKEKERLQAVALKEKERLAKEKEKEREAKEKAKQAALKEKERLQAVALKEKEKERLRVAAQKEKERLEREKEKERERIRKEKEKLEAIRRREEERVRKEKEREAYRKAREAERARVRAEKESAKRALEGKFARQARQAQKGAASARGGSARVYRPDAIPSQAGTTREHQEAQRTLARIPPPHLRVRPSVPPMAVKPPPPIQLDERWGAILERLAEMPERFQREYAESFDMSWIHHDSALEGVVYTFQELKTAIDENITIVPDSGLQPVCEEIRRHKAAVDVVRELGANDVPLTADVMKRLYLILHPEEGDLKSVKYRKEIPQHRLYFHEYAAPDKIAVRIRQAFEWFHGPEPEKLKDPIRVAARLHYDLLRTFPFPDDSGKVARMMMNIVLLRAKYPPVILHSTERQRYYDALRGALPTIVQMVTDSLKNAMINIEKVLDEEDEKEAQSSQGGEAIGA